MRSPARLNRGPAAAAENRAAIMAAARSVFTQHGPSAPMSLISSTAEVSPGVLYRHFPTRDSLTRAVFDEDVASIEALARTDCTLDELLAAFRDQLVDCTAFVSTLRPDAYDPERAEVGARVSALLTEKLATDTTHTFGPRITARQLLLAMALIAALLTKTAEPARRAVADESWQLLVDGLRVTD